MSASQWVKVPVGPQSRRWNTAPAERTVLIVEASAGTPKTLVADIVTGSLNQFLNLE